MTKANFEKGIPWRFGPDWPGQRCGAKTRKSSGEKTVKNIKCTTRNLLNARGWPEIVKVLGGLEH